MKVLAMKTDETGRTQGTGGFDYLSRQSAHWERENLKPNAAYACILAPIPEGWRLAVTGDLAMGSKSHKGNGWEDFHGFEGQKLTIHDGTYIYIVPQTPPQPKLSLLLDGVEVELTDSQEALIRKGVEK